MKKKVEGGKLRLGRMRKIGMAVLTAEFSEAALRGTLEHFTVG